MASSPTASNGFEKQGTGENANAWGQRLNVALDMIDARTDGVAGVVVTTDWNLTITNYVVSDGLKNVQRMTGTPPADFTVTLPSRALSRWFHNLTGRTATITNGAGVDATVRNGQLAFVYSDVTAGCFVADPKTTRLDEFAAPTSPVSLGGQRGTNAAAGVAPTDLINKAQLDAKVFAADLIPSGSAIGQVPRWDGAGYQPGALDLSNSDAVTSQLPVAYGGTGAGTPAGARQNIIGATTGNALKGVRVNAGGTDYELAALPVPKITIFTAGGTYTKDPAAVIIMIEAFAGGGSGARGPSNNAGGGGGERVFRILKAADVGATETVTIGAGGAARTSSIAGADGGNTTVGALVTARGGKGGATHGSNTVYGLPGWVGSATVPPGGSTASAVATPAFVDWPQGGVASSAVDSGSSVEGGGAGGSSQGVSLIRAAGSSLLAGAGGSASNASNTSASPGVAPAGGGGARYVNGTGDSGAGARGEVRIYEFLGG